MQCSAHARTGAPCRYHAAAGATVCRFHGGSAPQVLAAARRRILAAADPVAARLIEIATSKKTEPRDAIAAAREILNRAGLTAEPAATPGGDRGQVLWDEFVAIYRRRVPSVALEELP